MQIPQAYNAATSRRGYQKKRDGFIASIIDSSGKTLPCNEQVAITKLIDWILSTLKLCHLSEGCRQVSSNAYCPDKEFLRVFDVCPNINHKSYTKLAIGCFTQSRISSGIDFYHLTLKPILFSS